MDLLDTMRNDHPTLISSNITVILPTYTYNGYRFGGWATRSLSVDNWHQNTDSRCRWIQVILNFSRDAPWFQPSDGFANPLLT